MNDKVISMITEYIPFEQGSRVLVGLSGGADSVALLDFLWENREKLGIEVMACHINHMLRGEESDHDEEFVRTLCKKMGIELFVKKIDVNALAAREKLSVEEAAREARYSFFGEIAEEKSAKIATAHTLSDSMETIIFNLARGTGLKGLCGIPPVRDNIIRPLIYVTRAEVEKYLSEQGLSYVTDSTNNTDDYTRNRIRHHIIPKLYELNENADTAILRMIETLKAENDFLENMGRAFLEGISHDGKYSLELFNAGDIAIKRRAILTLLRENEIEVSSQRVNEIITELNFPCKIELKRGIFLKITETDFSIEHEAIIETYFEIEIPRETLLNEFEIQPFDGKLVNFAPNNCEQWKNSKKSHECVLKNCIDYDKICGNVVLRQRKAGDEIRLPERNLTKTLKKLFNEAGLSISDRSKRIILTDDLGVLFVEGFGTTERAFVNENTMTKIFVNIWGGQENAE